MNQLFEMDIIVRTLIGRLVELHGAANVADCAQARKVDHDYDLKVTENQCLAVPAGVQQWRLFTALPVTTSIRPLVAIRNQG